MKRQTSDSEILTSNSCVFPAPAASVNPLQRIRLPHIIQKVRIHGIFFAPYRISKAEDFEKHLNNFNVIKIDLNAMYGTWIGMTAEERSGHSFVIFFRRKSAKNSKKISDISFGSPTTCRFRLIPSNSCASPQTHSTISVPEHTPLQS